VRAKVQKLALDCLCYMLLRSPLFMKSLRKAPTNRHPTVSRFSLISTNPHL